VNLVLSNLCEKIDGKFDLIVSNPPYIKESSHRNLVHSSVDQHEPHVALYLPDDTYDIWFRNFFQQVKDHLHGTFMMEGHELEVEAQGKILEELGFKQVKVLKDLTGTQRFLKAQFI
jgi:release factor glutamine methyltransferase